MLDLSDMSFKLFLKKNLICIIWSLEDQMWIFQGITLLFSGTGQVKDNWNCIYIPNVFFCFFIQFSHCSENISTGISHCNIKANQNLPTVSYF